MLLVIFLINLLVFLDLTRILILVAVLNLLLFLEMLLALCHRRNGLLVEGLRLKVAVVLAHLLGLRKRVLWVEV